MGHALSLKLDLHKHQGMASIDAYSFHRTIQVYLQMGSFRILTNGLDTAVTVVMGIYFQCFDGTVTDSYSPMTSTPEGYTIMLIITLLVEAHPIPKKNLNFLLKFCMH